MRDQHALLPAAMERAVARRPDDDRDDLGRPPRARGTSVSARLRRVRCDLRALRATRGGFARMEFVMLTLSEAKGKHLAGEILRSAQDDVSRFADPDRVKQGWYLIARNRVSKIRAVNI